MVKRANVVFAHPPAAPTHYLVARHLEGGWLGSSPDAAPHNASFRARCEAAGGVVVRYSAPELAALVAPKARAA